MKDSVPILGYVFWDASGQQCHYRAIASRNNYFGNVDYSFLRGFITARISKTKHCTLFNLYYIYIYENILWNKACESVTSNKLMYILSINLLNIFCINE